MKCDFCNAEFELSEDSIIERVVSEEKDIREVFFDCPECNHHYKIAITDPEMRKAIERRRMVSTIIQTKYRGSGNVVQVRKLMKEDRQLKEFLEKRGKELEELLKEGDIDER